MRFKNVQREFKKAKDEGHKEEEEEEKPHHHHHHEKQPEFPSKLSFFK